MPISTPDVEWIFGTPLLSILWPNVDVLNKQLSTVILTAERSDLGVRRSNLSGWQSSGTLTGWPDPAVSSLLQIINQATGRLMAQLGVIDPNNTATVNWSTVAWANVNRRGDSNCIHHHNNSGVCFWSGIYYVAASGDAESAGGHLVLRNPSANGHIARLTQAPDSLRQRFKTECVIRPQSGLLLLFPSWLEHWVTPHCGEEPRISVAFNIRID